MTKEQLKHLVVSYLQNNNLNIGSYPYILVCIDESIEISMNSTMNDVPVLAHKSYIEVIQLILERSQRLAKSFLLIDSAVRIVYRGVPVPSGSERLQLLQELNQLDIQC